jgi:hypothetical protein
MLGSFGNEVVHDGHLKLSYTDTQNWPRHTAALPEYSFPAQVYTAAIFGDRLAGPAIEMATSAPVDQRGLWPTHWHATDSFRMSLRGELLMLPDSYKAGEFLFMEAGRYYNQGFGVDSPEGGWVYVLLADKRGLPGKNAKPEKSRDFVKAYIEASPPFMMVEERHDLVPGVHPKDSEGTPGIVTTIGQCKGGRLEGSFSDYESWTPSGDGVWLAGALLGDHVAGPLLLLSHTAPGAVATPAATFASEVARTAVRGSGWVGEDAFVLGDTRIQEAESRHELVVAGPDGLDEVIVFGDRRAILTEIDHSHSWMGSFASILNGLGVLTTTS